MHSWCSSGGLVAVGLGVGPGSGLGAGPGVLAGVSPSVGPGVARARCWYETWSSAQIVVELATGMAWEAGASCCRTGCAAGRELLAGEHVESVGR